MAAPPEKTETASTAPNWRRRAVWGAVGILIVAVVVGILAVNRAPIAEILVKDKLAGLGLAGSELEITRLTPWSVEVRNLTTGPQGTARIARLEADIVWHSWTNPTVSAVTLDGVQLALSVSKSGVPDWGDLAPLMSGDGGSGPSTIPLIALRDALVEISHSGGPTVVSLGRADISGDDGGTILLKDAVFDVVHPLAQGSLRASGQRAADGTLDMTLKVEGAQASWQDMSLADLEGRLKVTGDPLRLSSLSGEGRLNLAGLAMPGGMLTGGHVAVRLADGAGEFDLKLADEGLALTLSAQARGRLGDTAAVLDVTVTAAGADLARLPIANRLKGAGELRLVASAPFSVFLAAGVEKAPEADISTTLDQVEVVGVPGIWSGRARGKVTVADRTATLMLTEPAEISGQVFEGGISARIPGSARFGLAPFKVTDVSLDPLRLAVTKAVAGGIVVNGPLDLLLTPKDGGLVFANDDRVVALSKAGFTIAAQSPSLTVSSGGQGAVLRTAGLKGRIAATFPIEGQPGMRLNLSGLDAHVPDFDVEAQGISLTAASRGGLDESWNLNAKATSLRHTSAAPFSLDAKGHWNKRKWKAEGTLRQQGSGLIASLSADEDTRSGKGHARVDTLPLNLSAVPGGVHGITPLLAPFINSLTGTVQVSATTAWDKAGAKPVEVTGTLRGAGVTPAAALLPAALKGAVAGISTLSVAATLPPGDPSAGRGSIGIAGGNLRVGPAQATGISAQVKLDRLWPPLTPPGQELRVDRIAATLPVSDGRMKFQITGPSSVAIERAELTSIGGRLWADDIAITDGALPERVILNVDRLGLSDLAAQANVLGLRADGLLSGRIPIDLGQDGNVTIRDGLLEAQGKGLVSFVPPARAAAQAGEGAGQGGRMDLVLDVLEDLRFDGMTMKIDGDARKDVNIRLRLQGRNPKIQEGRPVDLTVNLSGNLGEAIQAEFQNFDIKGLTGVGTQENRR
ncbi:MAG: YdbH domain-containing protein [Rhodospirillales bacterium]